MSEDAAPASAPPSDSKPGLVTQLQSFPHTFWWANWMELVERFAYYGLRTVLPIYMVMAYEDGGPQFSHEEKGTIFMAWAMVQSFVPIFTGGFADRYGYKVNIAISTVVKILGYLVMGYAIEMGGFFNGQSLDEYGGAAGGTYTLPIFFTGAMLLAAGTAIFKPGVQGLIAHGMTDKNRSFGWGIFYQMVNVGGFIGPLIAAVLQLISWKAVFLLCAVGIALNFIPLFMFAEPKRKEGEGYTGKSAWHVITDTLVEFLRPRVFLFTLAFAGFWLMFYQLFDILPNFIDDWVDSTAIVASLQSILPGSLVPANAEGNLNQAWMINLDAGMIMTTAFLFGFLTGRFKSLPTMCVGILLSAITIYMLGMSMNGWWCLFAIGLFAIGEMVASPTKLRYMNEIAPKGKEGLFLGFANATVGIGWAIGSVIAGAWYEEGGDKVNLALRDYVTENGRASFVQELSEDELVRGYASHLDLNPMQTLTLLFNSQSIAAETDPVALTAWYTEKEFADADFSKVNTTSMESASADIAALAFIRVEDVALIPAASKDDVGQAQWDIARTKLEVYPPASEKLALIKKDRALPNRLGKELGIDVYYAQRLLFIPEFINPDVSIESITSSVHPLWVVENPKDTAGEAMKGLFDDVRLGDQSAAILSMIGGDLRDKLSAKQFEDVKALTTQIESGTLPVSAAAASVRPVLLAQAESLVTAEAESEEAADKAVTSLMKRTRVTTVAANARGLDTLAFKEHLWETYEPFRMWGRFALIGIGSMILLIIYDYGVRRYDSKHPVAA